MSIMNRIGSTFAVALLAVSTVGVQHAGAQSYLMPSTPERGIWLEASHPNIKSPLEVTTPSSAWFLSGRHPVTSRISGVAEAPFAYGKLDIAGLPEGDGSTVFGNPYLGMEFAHSDRVTLELGARIPMTTADEDSFGDVVGVLADPLRSEAFLEDVVPLSGAVSFRETLPVGEGATVRARGGIVTMFYTGDDEELDETTTFVDYGVTGTYPIGIARRGAGVSGRWNASESEGKFSDNSLHQLGLSADASVRGFIRPGISLRVPLDKDYRDLVGSTVGLYVQVSMP